MTEESDRDARAITDYLAELKIYAGSYKWADKGHKDYTEVILPRTCRTMPEINGNLILTAHRTRIPQKFSFTLLVGSTRVAALDVNPGGYHLNRSTLQIIRETHWQWFPTMEEAIEDAREFRHSAWLAEFCVRARVELNGPYQPPPLDEVQLDLL